MSADKLQATITSGWGERWRFTFYTANGYARLIEVDDETRDKFTIELGRFVGYREALARAYASVSPNPRWGAKGKRLAEYGATVRAVGDMAPFREGR